ncbi:aspartate aminotransferase family protein [Phormidium tenue FACHB-886]|nr:aspartate aminotransferase family protein [Phormidium tenue FACHB-886]
MNLLAQDAAQLPALLNQVLAEADRFFQALPDRPAGTSPQPIAPEPLPQEGLGAENALKVFRQRFADAMTGSAGSRYFGFVTGGATPAALAGDWLTSVYDQNAFGAADSAAPYIEREAIGWLRQLFGLSEGHQGTFVTGATMANFVGLAIGRQWVGHQWGVNLAESGLAGLPAIKVLSGAPHSCTFKAMSMLGMGRKNLEIVPCLPDREAIDLAALRQALHQAASTQSPCIVVANAGTVNTVDFDGLQAIAALKQDFRFWLHVDAAFGGFAACSPMYRSRVAGLDLADSIAIDAHKWLNVPYDAAMQFTQHRQLQVEVFQNSAAYLGLPTANPDFVHLTPENSRRLRALPAWFSLLAYGAAGYQEIVERNCAMAQLLGEKIDQSSEFRLLAPVRLNVVCFTLAIAPSAENIQQFLMVLNEQGRIFLTPTVYQGSPAMRAAFSNWRTGLADVAIAWEALCEAALKSRL